MTATATAQRQGLIGEAHVKVIRAFFAHLPAEVDVSTREAAEADLAGKAADLTLACGPDNRLAEKGWITRKNTHGDTEWLPPAHLDHGQPRINTFHHPEKLLHNDEDNDDDP